MVFKVLAMFLDPSSTSALLPFETHTFSSASANQEISKCTMTLPISGHLLLLVPDAETTVHCAFWTTVHFKAKFKFHAPQNIFPMPPI